MHPLQSIETAPRPPRAAVLRARDLARLRPYYERTLAILGLTISAIGTILAANGGYNHPARPGYIAAGLAVQGVCTLTEWLYRQRRATPLASLLATVGDLRYMLALIVDMALTLVGYGPAVWPFVLPFLLALGLSLPVAVLTGTLLLLLAALLVACMPEAVLIDGGA